MSIEHNSSLLAILDDDESVQSALQDLIESEGMSALCFELRRAIPGFREPDTRPRA